MTARYCLSLLILAGVAGRLATSKQSESIERLQPGLDQLIPADAKLEKIATGPNFSWTEGPVWVRPDVFLFAEIPSNTIYKMDQNGRLMIFMRPSGYQGTLPYGGAEPGSNGMTLDVQGRLTVAGHARRAVWRMDNLDAQLRLLTAGEGNAPKTNAPLTMLAENYQGKRLNSPNDLVYRSDGSLYFTDPPYGLRTKGDDDPEKQLRFNGVFRLKNALQHRAGAPPETGDLTLLIKDLTRPNGIAFSPDERYLYVDNSEPKKIWMRYPVNADGSLGAGILFADATSDPAPGSPDGMKVDGRGNIYSAGPGGVWIFSPDGKHLGTIRTSEKAANVAFGDADRKTLFITASTSIYKLRIKVAGEPIVRQ